MSDDGLQMPASDRELLEQKIVALDQKFDLKITARDEALKLQAEANRVHFDALNHEAARILKAAEGTVSRDTWDGHLNAYQEWKSTVENKLGLSSGYSSGSIQSNATLFQIITGLTSIGALITAVIALWRS